MTSARILLSAFLLLSVFCVLEPVTAPDSRRPVTALYLSLDWDAYQHLLGHVNQNRPVACTVLVVAADTAMRSRGELKIHGATSRVFPKKSFSLSLDGSRRIDGGKIFDPAFGAPERGSLVKDIVLNANALDLSMIRNYLSFLIARRLGMTVPRCGFAELYVNETYTGLFTVIEDVDKEMFTASFGHTFIDLHKAEDHNANLKAANTYFRADVEQVYRPNDSLVPPELGFKTKKGNVDRLRALEFWLESGGVTLDSLTRLTSPETLYAFILVNFCCNNKDGMSKNYYCAFDKISGRFEIIPWDMDATLGRTWNGMPTLPYRRLTEITDRNGLYRFLAGTPAWQDSLRRKYSDRYRAVLATESIIGGLEERLAEAVSRDMELWGEYNMAFFRNERGWDYWSTLAPKPPQRWFDELAIVRSALREQNAILEELLVTPEGRE